MFERAKQKIAPKVYRLVDGLARGLQEWAAEHVHAPTGGTADDKQGLLKRHGVDLEARPEQLDQQFSRRESGYLIRRYERGLQAADEGELHTEQVSTSGVDFQDDLPSGEDDNTTFQPVKVRGRSTSRGHGLYHQMWLTSSAYQRAWGTPLQGLITGDFTMDPPDLKDPTDEQIAEGEKRAERMERALVDNLEGGFYKFVTEWLYALVAGFAPFETIFHGAGEQAGLIKRMPFIYPSATDGWIQDEAGQRLEAMRFERADNGDDYVIEAQHLQLYSHLRLGSNFEGVSTLRSITRWIQTIQLLQQLENLSKERLGVPWIAASYEDPSAAPGSSDNDDKLMNILSDARAEESPAIRLPNGATMELHSAAGNEPDFSTPKEFAVQQVKQRLNAEGSLIAVGDTGAYAARESAEKDALQIAGYMGHLLCQNLNGANNLPHTGVVKKMEDARWGGPVQPGRYCKLTWSPGEVRDPQRAERINQGLTSGALSRGPSVEGAYRKEVGLPLSSRQERALQEGPDAIEDQTAEQQQPADGQKQLPDAPKQPAQLPDQQTRQLAAADEEAPPALTGWADIDDVEGPEVAAAGGLYITAAEDEEGGLDPEKASAKQDKLEAELANKLRSVAQDYRREFKKEVRELVLQRREGSIDFRSKGDTAGFLQKLNGKRDRLKNKYRSKFTAAAQEVIDKAAQKGAKDLVRSTGRTVGLQTDLDLSSTEMERRLEARDIATEALNRQTGVMNEKTVELARGDDTISLPILAESTFERTASRSVSGSYNAGRDAVVKEAKKQAARRGVKPDIIAERSSVLDSDTCDPCEGLDGERALVGSSKYESIRPPLKCEGRGKCRCIFSYILPDERGFDEAVQRLKRQ